MGDLNRLDGIYWFIRGQNKPSFWESFILAFVPEQRLEHDIEPTVVYKEIGKKIWLIRVED